MAAGPDGGSAEDPAFTISAVKVIESVIRLEEGDGFR